MLKKWQIIIDGTEPDEGYQKKNDFYLSRCYNRGESNEFTKYHRSVLEAKLYLGHDLVCSIASETRRTVHHAEGIADLQGLWQGNIEHACSFQEQAQKNHYLMEQISDFIKQLYEYFYLKKNEIKKLQKNIFPKWQALKYIYLSMLDSFTHE